jgi:hypothetical protein
LTRVGLISDTHGLLRPQAVEALRGCDFIVHGGDIGNATILDALRELAPLTVVRGNNDREPWADGIAETERATFGGIGLYAIHDLSRLDIDPPPPACAWWSRAIRTSRKWKSATACCTSTRAARARGASACPSRWPNC